MEDNTYRGVVHGDTNIRYPKLYIIGITVIKDSLDIKAKRYSDRQILSQKCRKHTSKK